MAGWTGRPMKKIIPINCSTWPRITIITPSYNQGEYIEETILSVLNQGYPNLEYFIVDGGSNDNTLEIIKKYENVLDWWVSEPDRGQSHAINKGLHRATGDLINWINSDDLLFPGALKRIAEAYKTQINKPHLIVGANARISEDGRILRVTSPPSTRAISIRSLMIMIGQQSSFFTKTALELAGFLREDLHAIMDYEFYYRILKRGGSIVRVRELIGAIRNHNKAKGFNQGDLWEREIPTYYQSINTNKLQAAVDFYRSRFLRCLDGSYWRSFMQTAKYRGKLITGQGYG
jgi:glycosyltransferase involved in cell wall biosynthesis